MKLSSQSYLSATLSSKSINKTYKNDEKGNSDATVPSKKLYKNDVCNEVHNYDAFASIENSEVYTKWLLLSFECDVCCQVFTRKSNLIKHVGRCTDKNNRKNTLLPCSICDCHSNTDVIEWFSDHFH